MTAAWPEDVPSGALIDTFRIEEPFRKPYRTTFEDGNRRARRTSTARKATVSFSLRPLSQEQFRSFALWVRDELVDGTLPFAMPVWTGTGDAYAERNCLFADDYQAAAVGGAFMSVALKLHVDDYIAAAPEPEPEP